MGGPMTGETDVVRSLLNAQSDGGLRDLLRADWVTANLPAGAADDDDTARRQLEVAVNRLDQLLRTAEMRGHVEGWARSQMNLQQQDGGPAADESRSDVWMPATDLPNIESMTETVQALAAVRGAVVSFLGGASDG